MANSQNKREAAKAAAKLDAAKDELLQLAGENAEHAFREVRLLHDQEGMVWIDAYRKVANRLRAEQRTETNEEETK